MRLSWHRPFQKSTAAALRPERGFSYACTNLVHGVPPRRHAASSPKHYGGAAMEKSPLAFFEHEKFGSLRVVRSDQGTQWFVAKDVCGCLGLDTSNLSKMLDEDELSTYPVQYTDQV